MSPSLLASQNRNISRAKNYAYRVTYPYLLLVGERDTLVDNTASREWHSKTRTPLANKEMRQISSSLHDLHKEPNNALMFEHILKFVSARLTPQSKSFGEVVASTIRFAKEVPFWKRKKFWMLFATLYLFIGLLIAIIRRRKNLFLSWPALLVLAKRLK